MSAALRWQLRLRLPRSRLVVRIPASVRALAILRSFTSQRERRSSLPKRVRNTNGRIMCFMVTHPMRTWTRVLTLLALVIALAGGSMAGGATRYGPPRQGIEVRQSVPSPKSAGGGQPQGHLAIKLVTRHFWQQELASSLILRGYGPMLQVKAQPPPPSSKCLASTLQFCPLFSCIQLSPADIYFCAHPGSGLRTLRSLYTRQQFSRPPPFFLV